MAAPITFVVAVKDAASGAISRIHGGLKNLGGVATGVGNQLMDWGKKAAIAAGIGVGAIAGLIVGKAIPAASNLAEQRSNNTVVFGKSAAGIIEWSKTTAKSLVISQAAALTATGTFGNLFRAIGIAEKPALDMSKAMVTLASDLASFNNATPEEALEALRAGLVGETEPLLKFGVNLNDATLRQKALELGLISSVRCF